jgi:DNA-directed RNA polymerase specialized sigma24 family protein
MNNHKQETSRTRSYRGGASRAETRIKQPDREMMELVSRTAHDKLRRQQLPIDRSDVEALCSQAWEELHKKAARGEDIPCVEPYLVTIACRRAIDELRRNGPARRLAVDVDLLAMNEGADWAAAMDNRTRIHAYLEAMREYLSGVELAAVGLCHIQGLSRPRAAVFLGVSDRRIQKIMDSATSKLAGPVELIMEDEWCSHQMSKIRALAAGMLNPDGRRYALAMTHLNNCSACRSYYLKRLRGFRGLPARPCVPQPAARAVVRRATASRSR